MWTPELVKPLVRLPFMVWARVAGDPSYQLEDYEAEAGAQGVAPVLEKWLPSSKHQEELICFLVLATLVGKRTVLKRKPKGRTGPQVPDAERNRRDPGPQGNRQDDVVPVVIEAGPEDFNTGHPG